MKANELRIGNYVENWFKKSHGFPDYIDEITAIFTERESTFNTKIYNSDSLSSACDFVTPIPLTEEWLVRLGFEKTFLNSELMSIFTKTANFEIGKNNNEHSFFLIGSDRVVYVNYVNQLQNLYFALTGEELCVKS